MKRYRSYSNLTYIILGLVFLAVMIYEYYQSQRTANPPLPTPTEAQIVQAMTPLVDTPPVTRTPAANRTSTSAPKPSATNKGSTAKFDYYVLALSWAPDYCATSGSGDVQECAIGKKLGFVLHGLWPQYATGYPSSCSLEKLPDSVWGKYPGLYPSDSLYNHEWEKHGTCSGLSPDAYLALTKKLKESVAIPDALKAPQTQIRMTAQQLRQAFQQVNPALSESSLEMNCSDSGRYLQEMYVCFSKDGSPTACGKDVHQDTQKSCPAGSFTIRNVH